MSENYQQSLSFLETEEPQQPMPMTKESSKRNAVKKEIRGEITAENKITNSNVVRSVNDDQESIILDIMKLFTNGKIECDVTFSKGVFYRNIPEPSYKFDINPVIEGVLQADCRNLPLENNSVESLMFDPPFVAGYKADNNKDGIIKSRFASYKNIPDLWNFYESALQEFYRVIKDGGFLIFKCQDTVDCGKNFFSHVKVMNMAHQIGFYPRDMFVLTANSRIIDSGMYAKGQSHARKYHSYFWVFEKKRVKMPY